MFRKSIDESVDAPGRKLRKIWNNKPAMLFMKGMPEKSSCGLRREVVNILKEEGVEFGSFDILIDEIVQEGLEKVGNKAIFPHLYCNGKLIGGHAKIVEMHRSGFLKKVLQNHGIPLNHGKSAGSALKEVREKPFPRNSASFPAIDVVAETL